MPLLGRELEIFPRNGLELSAAEYPWWIAQTRSRQEKALVRHLAPRAIPFYLPQWEKSIRRAGRSFVSFLPLFPGYVFFRGGAAERQAALRTNLLVRILEVHEQDQLDRELRELRALQLSGAALVPMPEFAPGDAVRILDGPFKGQDGVVLRRHSRLRLAVSITMLRRSVAVVLDRGVLAPVSSRTLVGTEERIAVA